MDDVSTIGGVLYLLASIDVGRIHCHDERGVVSMIGQPAVGGGVGDANQIVIRLVE